MFRLKQPALALVIGVAAVFPASAFAADKVVKQFTPGQGPNSVGIVPASEDTEVAAPQALYAGEGGRLFLLDQVNGRILNFDPKQPGQQPRALTLPGEIQPTDLVVMKGDIMVWDGDIHTLRATSSDEDAPTRGLEEYETRAGEDNFAVSAFAQMGSQKPGADADVFEENTRALSSEASRSVSRQYVATKGRGNVVATITRDKPNASAQIEVRGQAGAPNAKLKMKVGDRLGAIEFLEIDKQGRMFVLAENIPVSSNERAYAFVARFAQSGALDGIYELPLSQSVALSRRFVTVSADGEVFFLRTRHASVDVLGVGFKPLRNVKVIESPMGSSQPAFVDPMARRMAQGKGKAAIAAIRPLTRQEVIQTAFAFESIRWRPTRQSYGSDPDTVCTGFNRIRRPGYLHGKLGLEVRGIPYCWGCHGNLTQIKTKFDRGVLAGNVCTKNNPRSDVAGVDCSAFVSATWGLAQHYTTMAIPSIAKPVSNPWELLPGDAFNRPGSHVMLFLRFTPDRKVEVMEASPGACNGRVCKNVYPLSALLARGYTPLRYAALAKAPAPPPVVAEAKEKEKPRAASRLHEDEEERARKKPRSSRSRGR
jgi:hypothetical protein